MNPEAPSSSVPSSRTAAAPTVHPVHELLVEIRDSADRLLGRAARGRWQTASDVVDRLLATLEGESEAFCGLS
ncbi:MAG TPA: hypothetical protein VMW27_27595 [Thermoanaerobaculia bacterium]|nr:hypothetical protein [Thermoanaerobaculia bacterium]